MKNPETHTTSEHELAKQETHEAQKLEIQLGEKKVDLSDKELHARLLDSLVKIKEHPLWKTKFVEGFWNKLTPEDQKLLYESKKPSVFNTIKEGITSSPFLPPMPNLKYKKFSLKFFGDSLAKSVRPMVHYDMLPAPQGMSKEEIAKDIVGDQKSTKRLLSMLQIIVTVFAPELEPEVQKAKAIGDALVDAKTTVAKRQQEKKGEES
jgi:hypothetical protein